MANQPKKYKKFVATAATATLVASAIVPVASAASLSDIKGNTHEGAINALVDAGVISGYPDGTFKPNKELTRSDVVKLLGKYLVSQGHSIPADAASNPRFADLSSKTNKELLEYAAVVADAGVFAGSNGKLLAGDAITRENMAIVLVRMVNTLNDVSLEEYVATQDFTREVKDINTAKAEARTAIDVLDFYDITSVANFLPKNTVTRGQFATFLNNVIKADFSGAAATTGTVKAINNTTVEVTFAENIEDIKALDFKIEGLEVKNAVVKQTDKKTAVLTTAAQVAAKEYTVTVNTNTVGKFTGVSAVIPSKIDVTTSSLQGIIGKEVTIKAQVTVPEGQSKAGIPVTFNITSNSANTDKVEVQSVTNAEGVATYTYTRYYASEDTFTAYATDKSSVFSNGKVYWANDIQLAVSEITSGNDLANETKKSYKVTGDANTVYYIAIKENLGVTPDKITQVKVQNYNTTPETTDDIKTPYTLSTSSQHEVAAVRTNANGEGSFTVYGSNLSATPIVYSPESTPTTPQTYTYNKLDLQAEAPTVKFSQVNQLALKVVGEGTLNSAETAVNFSTGNVAYDATSVGGRTYTVTVTDKDGKVAPAGTTAYVTFESGNYSIANGGGLYFSTGTQDFQSILKTDGTPKVLAVTVGAEGKAKFRVAGSGATTFVKPTVFLNTAGSTTDPALNKSGAATDIFEVAEVTYFKSASVTNAELSVEDEFGRTVSTLDAGKDAYFIYQSVDQNGFPYRPNAISTGNTTTNVWVPVTLPDGTIGYQQQVIPGTSVTEYNLTFDVTSLFGNASVKDAGGNPLTPSNPSQNLGNTKTYQIKSDAAGKAIVRVTSSATDTVTVNVSGSNTILPTKSASVGFVDSTIVPNEYSGTVESYNSIAGTLKFAGKNSVPLFGSNIVYRKGTDIIANYDAFVDLLHNATGPVSITRTVKDGVTTFNIYNVATSGVKPANTGLNVSYTAINGTVGTALTSAAPTVVGFPSDAALTYSVTTGTLPTGLSLNTNTGVISGTPSAVVDPATTVTVQVTDGTRSVSGTVAIKVVDLTAAQKLTADKGLIQAGTFEIPTANQTDQAAKTAWVQGAVNALVANGTTATVTWNAGTSKYDVALTNGTATGTAAITVTEQQLTAAQKVTADKGLIEAGTFEIPTANQTDQAAKTAWVQGAVNALVANGTTATVTWNAGTSKYDVALTNGTATGTAAITVTEEV
ncbi:hypothetical protein A9986_07940 [Solibacillus silvestris]|nr:S-layer homology domain-containing protein [Solibacillus silvestris]OBW58866.1 hypothetical protein A9986_07940 [Solibacillus silvestris]